MPNYPDAAKASGSQSKALLSSHGSRFPEALAPQPHDVAERKRLLNAVIHNLKKYYIDPQVAQKPADALLTHEKNGDDNNVTDSGAFAGLLTKQIREVSHDMHLEVIYSQDPLPDLLPEPQRKASRVIEKRRIRTTAHSRKLKSCRTISAT